MSLYTVARLSGAPSVVFSASASSAGNTPEWVQQPSPETRVRLQESALARAGNRVSGMFAKVFRSFLVNQFIVNEFQVPIPNLPKPFEGLRIAQLSDLHIYRYTTLEYIQNILETLQQLKPDMVLLTGDAINQGKRFIGQAGNLLKQISVPLGKFACMGNHDYYDGAKGKLVIRMVEEAGFKMLINDAVAVEKEGHRLWISGIDDARRGKPNVAQTVKKVSAGEVHIGMAHNPKCADGLSKSSKPPHLILSGHTHGGQIVHPLLNWVRRLFFSKAELKHLQGWFQLGPSKLYVNSGLGSAWLCIRNEKMDFAMPPIRLNTTPEMTVFTLTKS